MPVKSFNSSILKWPNCKDVKEALRQWLKMEIARHPDVLKLGYFGSYAIGDWRVGSDLDLIAIVHNSPEPFENRPFQ